MKWNLYVFISLKFERRGILINQWILYIKIYNHIFLTLFYSRFMVLWPCVKGRWFDPILILLFATCSRFVYNRWRIQSHSAESVTWRFWWTLTRSSRLSHNRGGRCLLRCCGCGLWYLGCDLWHRGWHCWPCNTPSPPHSSKRNQEKDYSEKLVQILVWLKTLFFSFLLFISRVNTNYTT